MKAYEFKDILQKNDQVIHTIGTIIDSSILTNNQQLYFIQINREVNKILINK
ncbi:unnamed protein product [Paramecium sonneborni]|uniref:Uncharacterized protein n=1 Tax=Paramecium sonneborni TaxID=65129 RepID=A0A8S1K9G7_9CILI|nr:unnamed protein product [Paramecium sonneborni]